MIKILTNWYNHWFIQPANRRLQQKIHQHQMNQKETAFLTAFIDARGDVKETMKQCPAGDELFWQECLRKHQSKEV